MQYLQDEVRTQNGIPEFHSWGEIPEGEQDPQIMLKVRGLRGGSNITQYQDILCVIWTYLFNSDYSGTGTPKNTYSFRGRRRGGHKHEV